MKKVWCILAALLALSCFFEDEPTTEPPYPEATSPANCLKCVEVSFTGRDAVLLDDMLSKAFVFYFDPDDVGMTPPGSQYLIPESWSYTQFRVAVGNMLEKAFSISLTIPTGTVGTPDPNATTYRAEDITIKALVMIDELNGYIADCGYCNFEFERYENEKGQKLWRLTTWEDNTAMQYDANPGVAPASFGKVLALYYQQQGG
jgi:hypothetical protein